MQLLKGITSPASLSRLPHLKRQYWGRHVWAWEYAQVSSDGMTDGLLREYIEQTHEEPIVENSRFQIKSSDSAD
jgi:putative transposase